MFDRFYLDGERSVSIAVALCVDSRDGPPGGFRGDAPIQGPQFDRLAGAQAALPPEVLLDNGSSHELRRILEVESSGVRAWDRQPLHHFVERRWNQTEGRCGNLLTAAGISEGGEDQGTFELIDQSAELSRFGCHRACQRCAHAPAFPGSRADVSPSRITCRGPAFRLQTLPQLPVARPGFGVRGWLRGLAAWAG
ncbi:MAG TPA: hypothetical protein VN461_12810 [Vicinamibacteria bacterium]|nr:hypothetical protein [Vicinamibacteria bacterium]